MIQKLKDCHLSEQDGENKKHCTMEDMSYAVAPLFKRGLIEIKKELVENKMLHCIHLTQDGIDYLEKLNISEKNALKESENQTS